MTYMYIFTSSVKGMSKELSDFKIVIMALFIVRLIQVHAVNSQNATFQYSH